MAITLQAVKDQASDQNFRQLALTLGNILAGGVKLARPGDHKLDFGSTVVTFSASSVSNTVAVPHALGKPPAVVLANLNAGTPSSTTVASLTAASFAVTGYFNIVFTGAQQVFWIALS
ncbi:MAG: hypothetical protein ACRDPE_15755 [Solirubrobacterales bacterium]